MKVGIMSMQRVCNYGSFLQAYGLMSILKKMGHNVEFVDYHPGKTVTFNENKKLYYKSVLREKVLNVATKVVDFLFFASNEQKYSLKFKSIYKKEFLPILNIGANPNYSPDIDILIIGSDEVFNCLQSNPEVGFSEDLFGGRYTKFRTISYAASFGNTTIDGLKHYNLDEKIKEYLSRFYAISVRDKNSFLVVEELTGIKPYVHLDPVLIYDFSSEIIIPPKEEDYIVVYAYRNRITKEEKNEIIRYAQKRKKKIYGIGGFQDFCDKNIMGSPFEILGYIKNSDCVFTDTFHGTIFSVINQKRFVTFIRKGHGKTYGNFEKIDDLLRRLELNDRAVDSIDNIDIIMERSIDYKKVNSIIDFERQNTMNYLIELIR